LTSAELEILDRAKSSILSIVGEAKHLNILELGPGEGIKTRLLLDYFMQKNVSCTYVPIDISAPYLEKIVKKYGTNCASIFDK